MRNLVLILNTPTGDEFARLPVPGVRFPKAGEGTFGASRPNPTALYEAIQAALTAEGLAVPLDPLDFRIAISRALVLEDGSTPEVLVRLPVQVEGVAAELDAANTENSNGGGLNDFPLGDGTVDNVDGDDAFEDFQEGEDG